jgi:hypothetical protein
MGGGGSKGTRITVRSWQQWYEVEALSVLTLDAVAYREEGFGVFKPPPSKFRSFDKAEPNSQFRGKYIRHCLVFLFHHPN